MPDGQQDRFDERDKRASEITPPPPTIHQRSSNEKREKERKNMSANLVSCESIAEFRVQKGREKGVRAINRYPKDN